MCLSIYSSSSLEVYSVISSDSRSRVPFAYRIAASIVRCMSDALEAL